MNVLARPAVWKYSKTLSSKKTMLDMLDQTSRRWKKLLNSYLASAIFLFHKALGHTAVGPSYGSLSITDNRTRRNYTIPIVNNAIRAIDFLQITAAGKGADFEDQFENSIRILDKGFLNTACTESAITLMWVFTRTMTWLFVDVGEPFKSDGKRGYIQYRDYSIEDLFKRNDYEEVIHLLIWGKLPTPEQKMTLRRKLAAEMKPFPCVVNVIQSFP